MALRSSFQVTEPSSAWLGPVTMTERVLAGPEPPGDQAGDEVILADGVARVNHGVAVVGDRIRGLALAVQ